MGENELKITAKDMLSDQLTLEQNALPKDFNKTRFIQNALSVVQNNPQLAQFKDRKQVVAGLVKGAYLGLDFMANECYLIPYQNTLRFQMSYIGCEKFVKKYSIRPIQDIYAKVVRQGDDFQEKIVNGQPSLDFSPIPFNDDPIIGAFAVVLYQDGGMEYETMSTKEINEVRNKYSKASDKNAWKEMFGEMARKTVLRRLTKHIPCSFESVEAQGAWDEGGDFEFKRREAPEVVENPFAKKEEEAIDVDATEVEAEQIELPEFLKGDEA